MLCTLTPLPAHGLRTGNRRRAEEPSELQLRVHQEGIKHCNKSRLHHRHHDHHHHHHHYWNAATHHQHMALPASFPRSMSSNPNPVKIGGPGLRSKRKVYEFKRKRALQTSFAPIKCFLEDLYLFYLYIYISISRSTYIYIYVSLALSISISIHLALVHTYLYVSSPIYNI